MLGDRAGDARVAHAAPRSEDGAPDPGRRRFLTLAGLGGFAWLLVGGALGRATRSATFPDPMPIQDAMANDLGAEYMELVRRAYHPGRSGELQLVLAPYNSSNYAPESRDLVTFYRATSHASVWMYLERVPLVVHAPGSPRSVGRHHARHARRPRSDDGRVDGLHRVAGGPGRDAVCRASPPPAPRRRSSSRS